MNEQYFTIKDNRTLQEVNDRLKEIERELETRDFPKNEVTPEQGELIEEQMATYAFYSQIRDGYDVARAGTVTKLDMGNSKSSLVSIFPYGESSTAPDNGKEPSNYAHCLVVLTNKFDENHLDFLYSPDRIGYKKTEVPIEFDNRCFFTSLGEFNLSRSIEKELKNTDPVTVSDMVEVINYIKDREKEFGISYGWKEEANLATAYALHENYVNGTAYVYNEVNFSEPEKISVARAIDLFERGYRADDFKLTEEQLDCGDAHTFESNRFIINETDTTRKGYEIFLEAFEKLNSVGQEAIKKAEDEIAKQKVPVEVVVSFDGYIKAASEITNENKKEFDEVAKYGNGGYEERHDNHAHTTTDPSKVGGNVDFEEVSDKGTIEKGQGELTHEEKQEIKAEKASAKNKVDYDSD